MKTAKKRSTLQAFLPYIILGVMLVIYIIGFMYRVSHRKHKPLQAPKGSVLMERGKAGK